MMIDRYFVIATPLGEQTPTDRLHYRLGPETALSYRPNRRWGSPLFDPTCFPDLYLVSNLLGGQDVRIELGAPVSLAPCDTIVAASDGLSDNLHWDEIVELIRKGPLDRAVDGLAALGRSRMETPEETAPSKRDDLTLIAIRRRSTSVYRGRRARR